MATRTISTKMAVEGESEYRQAIKNINTELTNLNSKLGVVKSEFQNNANSEEALTKKSEVLADKQEALTQKVQTCKDQLEKARSSVDTYKDKIADTESKLKENADAQAKMSDEVKEAGAQYNTEREKVADAEEQLAKLQGTTGDTSEEEKRLNATIDESKEAMQKLNDSTGGMAEQAADLQVEESKLNDDLSLNQSYLTAAEGACQGYETDMNKAQTQLNNTNAEIELNDKYLEEAANSADGCATSIDQFGNKTNTAGQGIENMNKNLDIMTLQMAQRELQKLFEGLCDAMMACVDAASEFEQQMSTVEAISGATGDEMKQLTEIAKEMGSTTSFTATEAGDALEYMALAGWDTDDMLDALPDVLDLAAASGGDLGETCDIVTDALTAFGYKASDTAEFADALAAASSNSNTTVEQLGSAFQKVGPMAGTMGYSVEDVSTALGLMADSGIKAESAGTALNTMLTRMSGTNSSAREELEKLNIEMYNTDGTARPLGDVIGDLREAFSNLSQSEQTEAAYNLAGQRGMSAMLSIVQASDEDYDKLTSSIDDCNGAAHDMAETKLDNYAGQVTLLESAWDGLKVEIGEQLTPVLGDVVEVLTNIVNWVTDFIQKNPEVVALITGLGTAIGVLAGVVGGIVAALKLWEIAQKAVNAVMDANPIMLVVAAVVALTAGIGALVTVLNKNYNPGVEESKSRVKDLNEELENLEDTVEETSDAIEENADTTDFLKNAIMNLLEKEQLSDAEKQKMADYVDELNELYPDLGLTIDETTGSLDMEADAFENLIDAAQGSSELTALAKEQEEAEKAVSDAEKDLTTAYDERDLVIAALNGDEDAYNQLVDEGSIKTGLLQGKTTALEKYERQLNKEIENGNDVLEEAQGYYDDCVTACADLEKELSGLSDAEYDSYQKVGSQTEMLCDALLDLQGSYEDAKVAAKESAEEQFSMFETVEKEAKKSADEILDALKSQQDYWKEYSNNLQDLQSRNIDGLNEMLKEMNDGSTEAAANIASFAEMSDEELAKVVDAWHGVNDSEDEWAENSAELTTEYTKQVQEMIDAFAEWVESNENLSQADKEYMTQMMSEYVEDISESEEEYEGTLEHISDSTQEYFSDSMGVVKESTDNVTDALKKQENAIKTYEGKMKPLADSINNVRSELNELRDKYNEVRDASIESAETQFGMFEQVEEVAVTSFEGIMAGLQSQVEYWNNYGDNINNVLSRNIDGIEEWVASWNDGSDDAVAAAASFAELSDEQLQTVVDYMQNDLTGAWEYSSESIAESQTNLTEKTAEFTEQEKQYIDDMMTSLDMSEEGKNMAWGFINEYIDGLAEGEEPMTEEYEAIIGDVQYFCEERLNQTNNFTDDFITGIFTKIQEADLTPEAEELIWNMVNAADEAMAEGDELTQNQLMQNINHITNTITEANLGPGAEQAIWEAIDAAQGALEEGESLTINTIDGIISETVGEYEEFRKHNKWFTEEWINDISETMTGLDFSEDAEQDAWNLITAYTDTLPNGVKPSQDAVDEIIQVVEDTLDMDDDAREEAISGIKSYYEGLQEAGVDNIDTLEDTMAIIVECYDLDDETREKAIEALQAYADGLGKNQHVTTDAAEEIIDGVIEKFENGEYDDAGEEAGSDYAEGIAETTDEAKSAGEDVGDAYVEGINSKSEDYKEAGVNAGKGYAEGIATSQKDIEKAAQEAAESSVKTFNSTLDEHSPSKITEESGKNFIAGYVNGVNSEENDMTKTLSSLANSGITTWNNSATHTVLFTSGVNTLQGYKDGLDSSKDTVYTKMENIAKQSIQKFTNQVSDKSAKVTGQNFITGFINGLNDRSSSLYNSMQNLAQNALNRFNSTLGVHSPSTEAEWSAEKTIEGWILGIDENADDAETSMSELAEDALSAFTTKFDESITGMVETAMDAEQTINGFAESLVSDFQTVEMSSNSLSLSLSTLASTTDKFDDSMEKDFKNTSMATNELVLSLSTFDKQLASTMNSTKQFANTSSLYKSGQDTIKGYVNGLNSESSSLYNSMMNVAQTALNKFNSTLGVHSPSTEMEKSAKNTIEGWLIGVDDNAGKVEDSMSTLASEAMDAFDVALDDDMGVLADLGNMTATVNLGNAEVNKNEHITIEMPIYAGKQYTKTEIVDIALDGINHKQINQYASRGVVL